MYIYRCARAHLNRLVSFDFFMRQIDRRTLAQTNTDEDTNIIKEIEERDFKLNKALGESKPLPNAFELFTKYPNRISRRNSGRTAGSASNFHKHLITTEIG